MKKLCIIGIILLFVGASIVEPTGGIKKENTIEPMGEE